MLEGGRTRADRCGGGEGGVNGGHWRGCACVRVGGPVWQEARPRGRGRGRSAGFETSLLRKGRSPKKEGRSAGRSPSRTRFGACANACPALLKRRHSYPALRCEALTSVVDPLRTILGSASGLYERRPSWFRNPSMQRDPQRTQMLRLCRIGGRIFPGKNPPRASVRQRSDGGCLGACRRVHDPRTTMSIPVCPRLPTPTPLSFISSFGNMCLWPLFPLPLASPSVRTSSPPRASTTHSAPPPG